MQKTTESRFRITAENRTQKIFASITRDLGLVKNAALSSSRSTLNATNQLNKSFGQSSSLVKNLRLSSYAASGAVGVLATVSVKEFAKFDDALTKSTAIMGGVNQEMREQMKKTALQLSKSSTESADELAKSYFYLASAGMDVKQSIAALPVVEKFATAGAFEMAKATDLLTDAQSALGMTSKDTAENIKNLNKVSDVLVKANTMANASVEQFSVALTSKAGVALKNVNKDIEEGAALLAVYADQGIKAELAGSQLHIVLRELTNAQRDNSDYFEQLKIKVFDASGAMHNMADIIEDLENAMTGMSTQQKLATLNQLGFASKAQSSLLPLIGLSDQIRDYESALRSAGGTTQEVADKQMTSFSSQMKLLKNSLSVLTIELGEKLAPAISKVVGGVKKLADLATAERTLVDILEDLDIAEKKLNKIGNKRNRSSDLKNQLENYIQGSSIETLKSEKAKIDAQIKSIQNLLENPVAKIKKGRRNSSKLESIVNNKDAIETSGFYLKDLNGDINKEFEKTPYLQKAILDKLDQKETQLKNLLLISEKLNNQIENIGEANPTLAEPNNNSLTAKESPLVPVPDFFDGFKIPEIKSPLETLKEQENQILDQYNEKVKEITNGEILIEQDKIAQINALRNEHWAQMISNKQAQSEIIKQIEAEELANSKLKAQEELELKEQQAKQEFNLKKQISNDLTDIAANTAGKQSGIYKAMFATSKAFSIAESIMAIQTGLANAAKLTWPANLGAMASVVSATSGIVSTIRGTNLSFLGGGEFKVGGSRTRGVDGKGGVDFTAHPGETVSVYDHTKGNPKPDSQPVNIQINVNNHASNAETKVTERTNGNKKIIDIFTIELGKKIRTGGNPLTKALEDTYTVNRGFA